MPEPTPQTVVERRLVMLFGCGLMLLLGSGLLSLWNVLRLIEASKQTAQLGDAVAADKVGSIARRMLVVDWVFGVSSLAMVGGAFVWLLRENRQRREVEDVLRQSKEDLERRVQERTTRLGEADLSLKASEERLRAILQTSVEGIITIDERGRIESMNPAAERLFGYSAAEAVGRNVSLLMPSPYREEHDRYLSNYCHTGEARIIGLGREVSGKRRDGTEFPMDLSVSEVRLPDRRLFTGFVRDITERKRLERELLEVSRREQERIGQDLHDGLGQQLTAIEFLCRVLEQRLEEGCPEEAPRAAHIAEHVRKSIGYTRQLARGLAPVELGAGGLPASLEELAGNVSATFGVGCVLEGQSVVNVDDPALATHLFRIAQEAVTNAIRHGKARRVSIALEEAPEAIELRVRDDGSGYDPGSGSRRGLGVPIMGHRATMVGGTISIRKAEGGGTVVICRVPRRATAGPAAEEGGGAS